MNEEYNSTQKVFNIYTNIKNMCKSLEEIKLNSPCYWNDNQFYKEKFVRIYSDIENHYYGYNEYILFCFYNLIFKNNIDLQGIITEKIKNVSKLFTRFQLEKDKAFIIELNKKLKLRPDPIVELFKIGESGFSMVYLLTKKKNISPIFFITFVKKVLTNQEESSILCHDDYLRFEFIMSQIPKYLNGGKFYEQNEVQI